MVKTCKIDRNEFGVREKQMEDNPDKEKQPPRKLCLNCAWRAACQKRFSVSVANGEVQCADYSYDLTLKEKSEHEALQ